MPKKIVKYELLNTGISGNTDPSESQHPIETLNVDISGDPGVLSPTHAYSKDFVIQDNLIAGAEKIYHLIDSKGDKYRLFLKDGNLLKENGVSVLKDPTIPIVDSNIYGNTIFIGKGKYEQSSYIFLKDDGLQNTSFVEYPQDIDSSNVFGSLIYETRVNDIENYLTIYNFSYKFNLIKKEIFKKENNGLAVRDKIISKITDTGKDILILDICYSPDLSEIYVLYSIDDELKVGKYNKGIIEGKIELSNKFTINLQPLTYDKGIYAPSKIEVLEINSSTNKRMVFAFSKADNEILNKNFLKHQNIYFFLDFSDSTSGTQTLTPLVFDYESNGTLARLGMVDIDNYYRDENFLSFDNSIYQYNISLNRMDVGSGYDPTFDTYSDVSIHNPNHKKNITFDNKALFDWYPGMPDKSILAIFGKGGVLPFPSLSDDARFLMGVIATPNNPFGYWIENRKEDAEKYISNSHWSTGTVSSTELSSGFIDGWGRSNDYLLLRGKERIGNNKGNCPVWRIVRHITENNEEEVYIDIPYTGFAKKESTENTLHNATNFNSIYDTYQGQGDPNAYKYFPFNFNRLRSTYSYCFPGMFLSFMAMDKDSLYKQGNFPKENGQTSNLIFSSSSITTLRIDSGITKESSNFFDGYSSIFLNMYARFGFGLSEEFSIYQAVLDAGDNALNQGNITNGTAYDQYWYGKGYIYGGQYIPDGEYCFRFKDMIVKRTAPIVDKKETIKIGNTSSEQGCENLYDSEWDTNKGNSNIFFRFSVWKKDNTPIYNDGGLNKSWYTYDNFHIQCFSAATDRNISFYKNGWDGTTQENIQSKVERVHTVENPLVKVGNNDILIYDSISPYFYSKDYLFRTIDQLMIFGVKYPNHVMENFQWVPYTNKYIIPYYSQSLYNFTSNTASLLNTSGVINIGTGLVVNENKDGEDLKINDITSIVIKRDRSDKGHIKLNIAYTRNTNYLDGEEGHNGEQVSVYKDINYYANAAAITGYKTIFNYNYPKSIESGISNNAVTIFPLVDIVDTDDLISIIQNGLTKYYYLGVDKENKDYILYPYNMNLTEEELSFYNTGFKINNIEILNSDEKGFSEDFSYRYGYCLETKSGNFSNFIGWKYDVNKTKNDRLLKVIVNKGFLISKGISAIRVFISYTPKSKNDWSFPEEIYSIELEDLIMFLNTSDGSANKEEDMNLLIEFKVGHTYNSLTGVSHTLVDNTLNYENSIISNNYMFVIDSVNESIANFNDSHYLLFRSKRDLLSTFDWSNDYIRIPERAIGLAAIHGKVLVFTASNISVIEAETLDFIQVVENLEIVDKHSWCIVEDKWMVISCKTGAYIFDGTEFVKISEELDHNWKDRNLEWKPYSKVFVFQKSNKVYFWNIEENDNKIKALVWHYPSKRWGYEEIPSGTTMIYNDIHEDIDLVNNPNPNGERYFYVTRNDWKLIETKGHNGVTFKYVTNPLDMGTPEVKKVLYGIRIRVKVGEGFKYHEVKVNNEYFYNVVITLISHSEKIYSMEILYREITERGASFVSMQENIQTLEKTITYPYEIIP